MLIILLLGTGVGYSPRIHLARITERNLTRKKNVLYDRR